MWHQLNRSDRARLMSGNGVTFAVVKGLAVWRKLTHNPLVACQSNMWLCRPRFPVKRLSKTGAGVADDRSNLRMPPADWTMAVTSLPIA